MVARLKLKGIDGRAPPEVNNKPFQRVYMCKHICLGFASKSSSSRDWCGVKRLLVCENTIIRKNYKPFILLSQATLSNCGKPLKL